MKVAAEHYRTVWLKSDSPQVVQIIDLSQTIPSADDVRAVPRPRAGRLIGYPVQVLRYGLNLYPGSRTARQNGLIGF